MYVSAYMRYLESSNSSTQKAEQWLPAFGRRGKLLLMGMEFQFCMMKRVLEMDAADGCTTM